MCPWWNHKMKTSIKKEWMVQRSDVCTEFGCTVFAGGFNPFSDHPYVLRSRGPENISDLTEVRDGSRETYGLREQQQFMDVDERRPNNKQTEKYKLLRFSRSRARLPRRLAATWHGQNARGDPLPRWLEATAWVPPKRVQKEKKINRDPDRQLAAASPAQRAHISPESKLAAVGVARS